MEEEGLRETLDRAFWAYVASLENVTVFKYLGRVMMSGDDDWTEVADNLRKARKSWVQMSRILSWEGADQKVLGNFLKAAVQVLLLFGADTWVLTPRMERALSSFKHRVAQRLTGRHPRSRGDGSWYYPPMEVEMLEAGFEEIGAYITRKQNTVAQYITTRPIMDLYEKSVRRLGAWVSRRWWYQEGLDLEGEKEISDLESDREEAQYEEEVLEQEETTGR